MFNPETDSQTAFKSKMERITPDQIVWHPLEVVQ